MKYILIVFAMFFYVGLKAQEWRIEIQPMTFSADGTGIYNDTATGFLVRLTPNMTEDSILVYAELYNKNTRIPVRPGRNYWMPKSVIPYLANIDSNMTAINVILQPFALVGIREDN